jgi:transcriptional regulator with XRE-family HTH domain
MIPNLISLREMDAGLILKEVRARKGLSRRQLAEMGGTSASTLAAYESGRSVPSVRTLERLVRSAGLELQVSLQTALTRDDDRKRDIDRLFELTDELPRRRRAALKFPRFPVSRRR